MLKHFEKKYVECRGEDGSVSFDDVEVTPQISEKYLQFQIGNLRFLDSFQFLFTSLEELVSLLIKSGKDNFVHTATHLGTDEFHDKLKNEPLSEEDYLRAIDTWHRFGFESLNNYHDHYLLTDVLLADVFENFRKTALKTHGLELLHLITLPSLAWAMALKHKDAELDLITDPDAYLMLETNLRGGIATISKRYALANSKHVEGYNEYEESRYITYLDANSLYATAQNETLPVGNFRFLNENEIENISLDSIAADASIGYIVECDLTSSDHLHDAHNDYPMAPEHLTVTTDMLSDYAVNLLDPGRPTVDTNQEVPAKLV